MSAVVDYLYQGAVDTYNETVDFWAKDGSIADAADTVVWSVENPDVVATATKKGIEKSANEFGNAVKKDTYKLLIIAAGIIGAYYYFTKKRGK